VHFSLLRVFCPWYAVVPQTSRYSQRWRINLHREEKELQLGAGTCDTKGFVDDTVVQKLNLKW
jgi:hypothetical protein